MSKKNEKEKKILKAIIQDENGNEFTARIVPEGSGHRIVSEGSAEAYKELKEKEKEITNYHNNGKIEERFGQILPKYEEEMIVNLSAKEMECIVRTMPYVQYTSKTHNENVIRYNDKNAKLTDFEKIWKVSNKTRIEYIKKFKELGYIREIKNEKGKTKGYQISDAIFIRGYNDTDVTTKKVILEKLSYLIPQIDKETEKFERYEKQRKKKNYGGYSLNPLALLGILISKVHFKSHYVLSNHRDEIVLGEATVLETLETKKGVRRFKFISNPELWSLLKGGTNKKKLEKEELTTLRDSIQILKNVFAIAGEDNGKKHMLLVNPELVFVNPNFKGDEEWERYVKSKFNIGKYAKGGLDFSEEN